MRSPGEHVVSLVVQGYAGFILGMGRGTRPGDVVVGVWIRDASFALLVGEIDVSVLLVPYLVWGEACIRKGRIPLSRGKWDLLVIRGLSYNLAYGIYGVSLVGIFLFLSERPMAITLFQWVLRILLRISYYITASLSKQR